MVKCDCGGTCVMPWRRGRVWVWHVWQHEAVWLNHDRSRSNLY